MENQVPKLKAYAFTIELPGVAALTDELSDQLYKAGCDDATISHSYSTLKVTFSREAESLQDAIASAQAQVLSVVKVFSIKVVADYDQ
jgi:hypothetical protein